MSFVARWLPHRHQIRVSVRFLWSMLPLLLVLCAAMGFAACNGGGGGGGGSDDGGGGGPDPLALQEGAFVDGLVGAPYSGDADSFVSGGLAPYAWSLEAGDLPDGLSLASDGAITGTPTYAGEFVFRLHVEDANADSLSGEFTLAVSAGSHAVFPSADAQIDDTASTLQAMEQGETVEVAEGEILVCLGPSATAQDYADVAAAAALWGGAIVGQVPAAGVIQIRLADEADVTSCRGDLALISGVAGTTRNLISTPQLNPNPATFAGDWWVNDINAPAGWDCTIGHANARVGVVDAGLDLACGHFPGKLTTVLNVPGATSLVPMNTHGTFVAGLAAARGDDGVLACGMAWSNRLVFCDVGDTNFNTGLLIAGITLAIDNGCRVVNLSFGSATATIPAYQLWRQAMTPGITYARDNDALVVISAGNDGQQPGMKNDDQLLPGGAPAADILAWQQFSVRVGSTRSDGLASDFSVEGAIIELAAPGEQVGSAVANQVNQIGVGDGTSFAAPLVSGLAGLVLTIDPNLTATQLRQVLIDNSAPVAGMTVIGEIVCDTTLQDVAPSFSIDDVVQMEGNPPGATGYGFTVTMSHSSLEVFTVDYTTQDGTATLADSDFVAASGTLTFAAGTTTQPVNVSVNADYWFEPDETFTVQLSNPGCATIADGSGLGTIQNDDSSALSINDVALVEGDAGSATLTFTVTLNPAAGAPVTVDFATSDSTATAGVDYDALAGSLLFNPGETTKPVQITVHGDTLDEVDETFLVTLSNEVGAPLADATGVGTITDNDPEPDLVIDDVSTPEPDGGSVAATFTITLGAISGRTVTVNYTTANVTAVSGSDYTAIAGVLTFNPGETVKTLDVSVLGDLSDEWDETYELRLSAPVGATITDGTGVGTITDNDPEPNMTINDRTIVEGSGGGATAFTFTVSLSVASGKTVTVDWTTQDGTATTADSDYVAGAGSHTFNPGQTTKQITVQVTRDSIGENDETFSVILSNAVNAVLADDTGVGLIDDDDTPTITINDVSVLEGNQGTVIITFVITMAPQAAVPITLDYTTQDGTATVANNDYGPVSGQITFAPGEAIKMVDVNVIDDTDVEADETFTLELSNVNLPAIFGDDSGLGTIRNDDQPPGVPGQLEFNVDVDFGPGNDSCLSVDLGDVDGDGDIDIVTGGGLFADSRVWRNNAAQGTFDAGSTIATSTEVTEAIRLADVDKDGDLDAVVGNSSATENRIWLNNGAGVFSGGPYFGPVWAVDAIIPANTVALVLADFDKDGWIDIAEGNSAQQNYVYINNGAGQYPLADRIAFGPGNDASNSLAVGDLNGDGNLDIVVANFGGQDVVYFGDGTGAFPTSANFGIGGGANLGTASVSVGDMDGDFDLDIVVGTLNNGSGSPPPPGQNKIWLNDGTGAFPTSVNFGAGNDRSRTVVAADMNGDGHLDIVVGNITSGSDPAQNVVYVNDGAGGFATAVNFGPANSRTQRIAVGQVDLDGSPDIVAVNNNQYNQVHLNNSNGYDASVSINDVSIAEGNAGTTVLTFTVSLNDISVFTINVDFTTEDDTATLADGDYVAVSGTLTFNPGETTKTIDVTINGDVNLESDETLRVVLSNVVNSFLNDSIGIGTITNDD